MNSQLIADALELPLAERIELIDELWASVRQEGYEPPLTPEQASELDRRLEAHRRDPDDVVSWDSIRQDFSNRYRNR